MRRVLSILLVAGAGCGRKPEQQQGQVGGTPAPAEPPAAVVGTPTVRPEAPGGDRRVAIPVLPPPGTSPAKPGRVEGLGVGSAPNSDAAVTRSADESTDLRSLVEEYAQNAKAADELYRGRSLVVWPCWVIGTSTAADGRLVARIGYGETSAVAVCVVAAGKDTDVFLERTRKKKAVAIVGTADRPREKMPVLLNARAVYVGDGARVARWVDEVRR
jgi:hypothetical protein